MSHKLTLSQVSYRFCENIFMSAQIRSHIGQNCCSIISFLRHCSRINNLCAIRRIHAHLIRSCLLYTSFNLLPHLILSYSSIVQKFSPQNLARFFKCIDLRNSLAFNVIISALAHDGFAYYALTTFSFMHTHGVPIDTYSLCSSLVASSFVGDNRFGRQLHTLIMKSGWWSSPFLGSALIDMYGKTLMLNDAVQVFDEIPVKNTVCANALMSGYGESKMWIEGLELVQKMPILNLRYDHFTLSATLRACTGLSAIELGRQVHGYLIRTISGVVSDVFLQSSLIEMYGKCGMVEKAWQVFNVSGLEQKEGRNRDIVLWTSILGVYGKNGCYQKVIGLYNEMLIDGIRPDAVAFVTVISACGHTGQVSLGVEYFDSMVTEFGVDPRPEHYSCLIDVLCRAGELDKAWKLLTAAMERKGHGIASVSLWGSFLSACMEHGNVKLGNLAASKALEFDPCNAGIYVMLSNLYARFGMWNEIEHLRDLVRDRGLKKDSGCSWVEVTPSLVL